ncbi:MULTISPECIES: hypothetical protein [Sorangium]|uniref:hypothetical protein n=1 Tax=Sorangium TaxID=39643 RepID=UPI003D9C3280
MESRTKRSSPREERAGLDDLDLPPLLSKLGIEPCYDAGVPRRRTAEITSVNVAALASAARRGEVELAIVGACLVLAGTNTVQLETTRVASGGLRL